MDINSLKIRLSLLSSLRNLLDTPIISAYKAVLDAKTADDFTNNYASLCHKIYNTGDACVSVLNDISCDENALTANLENPNQDIVNSVTLDLQTISEILKLKTKDFNKYIKNNFPELTSCSDFMPNLPKCKEFPFSKCSELLEHYKNNGFGFFAKASSFTVNENGKILPVLCPDTITLKDLKGYQRQRGQVIANTVAFLNKKPANNILLYGDKGTGKTAYATYLKNNNYKGVKANVINIAETDYKIFYQLKKEHDLTLTDYTRIWKIIILMNFLFLIVLICTMIFNLMINHALHGFFVTDFTIFFRIFPSFLHKVCYNN